MNLIALEVILFRKENKSVIYFCLFSLLSCCYLFFMMRGHILHYLCLKKAHLNLFGGPQYGFTAPTAFSGKFYLDFCSLSLFLPHKETNEDRS